MSLVYPQGSYKFRLCFPLRFPLCQPLICSTVCPSYRVFVLYVLSLFRLSFDLTLVELTPLALLASQGYIFHCAVSMLCHNRIKILLWFITVAAACRNGHTKFINTFLDTGWDSFYVHAIWFNSTSATSVVNLSSKRNMYKLNFAMSTILILFLICVDLCYCLFEQWWAMMSTAEGLVTWGMSSKPTEWGLLVSSSDRTCIQNLLNIYICRCCFIGVII